MVDVLPPPRHGGSNGAAERPAPDSLARAAQIRIASDRIGPATIIGSILANLHWPAIALMVESRFVCIGQSWIGLSVEVGVPGKEIQLRHRPQSRIHTGV